MPCPFGIESQAILWQNGVVTNLDPIVKDPGGEPAVAHCAVAVNNHGQIVVQGYSLSGSLFLLTPNPPPGDVNIDCAVNVLDLMLLFDNWGAVTSDAVLRADLDGDGVVGGFELALVLGGWTPR
ncbi:MAG: hypothetical protein SGJ11_15400 [Phycisphaerae bacterium]|nr:hypothetical protein [Phycisphaerae bacterium]